MIKNNSILLRGQSVNNSKQFKAANKMFGGSRGKTPKIGKKFSGNLKSSSISPSVSEFDDMLSSASIGGKRKKASFFKKNKKF